jgi:hypothetical protein
MRSKARAALAYVAASMVFGLLAVNDRLSGDVMFLMDFARTLHHRSVLPPT